MILDTFNLEGKVAIVTGASRGLGQGIAVSLAEAGCDIVGISTKESPETGDLIRKVGKKYLDIPVDLTSQDELDSVIKRVVDTFSKVDILVNNSGIIRRADALEFSEKDWDDVMNVNLKSTFFFSQKNS